MTHKKTDEERDPAVILRGVAAFLFFATVIAFLTGLSLLFPAFAWDGMWSLNPSAHHVFEKLGPVLAIFLLLVGTATCAIAIGFLKRKKWAWICVARTVRHQWRR